MVHPVRAGSVPSDAAKNACGKDADSCVLVCLRRLVCAGVCRVRWWIGGAKSAPTSTCGGFRNNHFSFFRECRTGNNQHGNSGDRAGVERICRGSASDSERDTGRSCRQPCEPISGAVWDEYDVAAGCISDRRGGEYNGNGTGSEWESVAHRDACLDGTERSGRDGFAEHVRADRRDSGGGRSRRRTAPSPYGL